MLYEVMTILPSSYSDTEIDSVIDVVAKKVTAGGAKIEKTVNLGKLKLAYPVAHNRFGTYVLFYVEAEKGTVAKLDQDLRLADEVIRHLILAREKGIPAADFRPSSYQPPVTPEGRRAGDRDERPPSSRPAATDVSKAGKLTTEALNEKLDQILDSDIMRNI